MAAIEICVFIDVALLGPSEGWLLINLRSFNLKATEDVEDSYGDRKGLTVGVFC